MHLTKKALPFRNRLYSFLLLMMCQEVFHIFLYSLTTSFFIYCESKICFCHVIFFFPESHTRFVSICEIYYSLKQPKIVILGGGRRGKNQNFIIKYGSTSGKTKLYIYVCILNFIIKYGFTSGKTKLYIYVCILNVFRLYIHVYTLYIHMYT